MPFPVPSLHSLCHMSLDRMYFQTVKGETENLRELTHKYTVVLPKGTTTGLPTKKRCSILKQSFHFIYS